MPSSSMRSSDAWSAGRFAWTSVMTATASGTGRHVLGAWRSVAADELVREGAQRRAGDRARNVDPEVAPLARGERGAKRARRVHRGAGDRAAEEGIEPDRPADRDRRGGSDSARIGGDGHDHEHQE